MVYCNLAEKVDEELSQAQLMPPLYISQVTDALQPLKQVRRITYEVIEVILKHRVSFHIVTKSADGPLELLQAIPQLIKYPYWYLSITIEATPEKQAVTSPCSSPILERLETLKKYERLGIPISARTDPFILGFMEPEDALWLVDRIAEAGVKHLVSSCGYYNKLSMLRLLEALRQSPWKDCLPKVCEAYGFNENRVDEYKDRRRFLASYAHRVKYHTWLKKEVESRGLTYGVCQELPQEYDSENIVTCEGNHNNFVHIRGADGRFHPINCWGDCIRSCPDPTKPPCGLKELLSQYPYKATTIGLKPIKVKGATPSLF